MRVAVVDEELPYPLNSGKRVRTLNLLTRLASRHQITYVCHRNSDKGEARRAAEHLRDQGIETVVVERPVPPKSGPMFYVRLAANLMSPDPYSVATHDSRALRRAVGALAGTKTVDLWQCEWTPYFRALESLVDVPRVMMAHNVESRIWERYHDTECNLLKRWYIKRQLVKFRRFERWACREATRVVAVTRQDAALLRDEFGAGETEVVDNGVDTKFFTASNGLRDPAKILFLGSLDWRPNLDAVGLLLDHIFPEVLAQEPSARLCLVGRNPPDALVRRARALGVEVHPNVADVRPHMAGCGVMAVPLRVGGGSRLKILEALASGLPVVSTRIGAEGLHLEPGRDLDVVDRVDDMAGVLVACIRSPGRARALAESGRRVVHACYDWDSLAASLENVWERCLAPGHAVRGVARP